jgi:PAS domain S-box-containing protein
MGFGDDPMNGDLNRQDQREFDEAASRLKADRDFARFLQDGAVVIVWDASDSRILSSSAAAAPLVEILSGPSGSARLDPIARERLRLLASGLAPREGFRVERLHLTSDLAAPLSWACRQIELDYGPALATALVGTLPDLASGPAPEQPLSRPSATNAPAGRTLMQKETVRFVWQTDAARRFTRISPELGSVVGPMSADILGRTWDEVALSTVRDLADHEAESVASLLEARRTFSGHTVAWQVDHEPGEILVDLAGMPVFAADRSLLGYRGFGLARVESIWNPRSVQEEEDAGAVEPRPSEVIAPADEPQAGEHPADVQGPDSLDEDVSGESDRNDASAGLEEGALEAPDTEAEPPASEPEAATGLTSTERSAFREIARALGARFAAPAADAESGFKAVVPEPDASSRLAAELFDQLPLGVIVHRSGEVLFANRLLLDLTGYETLDALIAEGGLPHLFRGSPALLRFEEVTTPVAMSTRHRESVAVEVRHSQTNWGGDPAGLMLVRKLPEADAGQRLRDAELELRHREARTRELESILETATDGVIVIDEAGRVLSMNRSAEALFGYDQREVVGDAITVLLAPESHMAALDYLEGLRSSSVAALLNDGREVLGRVRQGGTIPLFMTLGHAADGPVRKLCAVLRDLTAFKQTEAELLAAKRTAEEANAQKSDLLAKISHEIRTPLNAIIGFAEVMLEERFGPIGNERYKDYLKDVHASGAHVISLVNDLLDLAKIEAGRMELSFSTVVLNDLVTACVTLLQPQAARDRIVMRTSFTQGLPSVVADERSIRQIVLNLVSNAIKFTDAGGQVIVSTALTDRGDIAFRVRDTGIGMSEEEIEAALEPFRQLATSRKRGGTGLGLPLTKALIEANRGAFRISSHPSEGTLVEVLFPPARVSASS